MIFSLILPPFASVGTVMPAEPCPMQTMMDGAQHALADEPCADMGDLASTDHKSVCKLGQDCKSSAMVQINPAQNLAPIRPLPQLTYFALTIQRVLADFWRPPRLA
ncbi:hypothetical protein BBI10_18050 [Pseudomonas graminis]|uniref:Uncharacterized protein n=1 Tax=Pseudomonas graminis TaxID=158627 RepID=A0A1C2DRL9_9PSED|nr:hypothetical protein BBI10_18050 [Pseudomonas graminis]